MTARQQAPAALSPSPRASAPDRSGFPLVAIGASAGGLDAFEAFFSGLPPGADPEMAFLLVQHLAPDHPSLLPGLVQRFTRLPVMEMADGMRVEVNHVYVLPAGQAVTLRQGALVLTAAPAASARRLPIDRFFTSLAEELGSRARCVVLSGTGSDGTLGVRAVKAAGGVALAQDPASCEYDGMPVSAIATGLVDQVLEPAKMLAHLRALAGPRAAARPPAPASELDGALARLFALLRARTGHDFSLYKPGTLQRRVERRMAALQVTSVAAYAACAEASPEEVSSLFHDLLIGVTRFFRDLPPEGTLEQRVLPALLAAHSSAGPLRVWSAGCSSGEEAYSLAILLAEQLDALKSALPVQLFATDLDLAALARARAGIYPASIAADVSAARLERFFSRVEGTGEYRVGPRLREMLIVSEHDLLRDPPFSRLDVLSCRNVLIYLRAELQRRLLPVFHYALRPGGYLLLGSSESAGRASRLFTPEPGAPWLYRRSGEPGAAERTLRRGKASSPAEVLAIPRRRRVARVEPVQELEAVNQELESANQELETSQEELRSVNDELASVNTRLEATVAQLSQSNDDMVNLLAGNGLGTIFVDAHLGILRFTPAATKLMNLLPGDVGRPVGDIVTRLVDYQRLGEDVQAVLDTLGAKELEVQASGGAWYLLRIRPYRTRANVVEGAVVTFVDITELRMSRQAQRLAVVVKDAQDAITVHDLEGKILAWNPAAERMYGWTEAEALGMNVRDRVPTEERAEALTRLRQLGRSEVLAPVRVHRLTRDGRRVEVTLTATVLGDQASQPYAIATTERALRW